MTSDNPHNQKNLENLLDSLDIIERNCQSFHEGHYPDYQTVAGKLRILLCDTNRGIDNSLALKVFPELRLHPMRNALTAEKVRIRLEELRKIDPSVGYPIHWEPYGITGIPAQVKYVNVFDLEGSNIPLTEWLNQYGVILDATPFTLKDMIKSVADKGGGAHFDENPNDYLAKASKVWHQGAQRRGTGQHEPIIIAIGEYVVHELRRQLV